MYALSEASCHKYGRLIMETKQSKAFASIKQGIEEALKFSDRSEEKTTIYRNTNLDTLQQL